MTVAMLIKRLTDAIEDGDITEEAEVRLATQPNYPLESEADGVATGADIEADDGDADVVYITEGRQIGYGTAGVFEVASV